MTGRRPRRRRPRPQPAGPPVAVARARRHPPINPLSPSGRSNPRSPLSPSGVSQVSAPDNRTYVVRPAATRYQRLRRRAQRVRQYLAQAATQNAIVTQYRTRMVTANNTQHQTEQFCPRRVPAVMNIAEFRNHTDRNGNMRVMDEDWGRAIRSMKTSLRVNNLNAGRNFYIPDFWLAFGKEQEREEQRVRQGPDTAVFYDDTWKAADEVHRLFIAYQDRFAHVRNAAIGVSYRVPRGHERRHSGVVIYGGTLDRMWYYEPLPQAAYNMQRLPTPVIHFCRLLGVQRVQVTRGQQPLNTNSCMKWALSAIYTVAAWGNVPAHVHLERILDVDRV